MNQGREPIALAHSMGAFIANDVHWRSSQRPGDGFVNPVKRNPHKSCGFLAQPRLASWIADYLRDRPL